MQITMKLLLFIVYYFFFYFVDSIKVD